MRCTTTRALTDEQRHEVIPLLRAATAHDGVRPLSEQSLLDVRHAAGEDTAHVLLHEGSADESAGQGTGHGALVGYAHLEGLGPAPAAELVVHPAHRRHGHGRSLAAGLLADHPGARLWAHGDLHEAHALSETLGLVVVRDLWQMALPLQGEWSDLPPVQVPSGYRVRRFEPGRDDEAWVGINARAFATHKEQGRMTLADLRARQAEAWFDPEGFLLLEDETDGSLAGFHWTKVEDPGHVPGAEGPANGTAASSGEVYVVGVDPSHQGRGLGRVVTLLGLHHLRGRGLAEATLYVDGDNSAAIATYTRLGFERTAVDVMYARPAGAGAQG